MSVTNILTALTQAIQKLVGGAKSTSTVPTPPSPASLTPKVSTPSPSVTTTTQKTTQQKPQTTVSSAIIQPQLNVQTSIVDYLKSKGLPSDFAYREQLARQYGITNYRGTAEQNIQLLNLLRQQEAKGTTPKPTTSVVSTTTRPTTTTTQTIPTTTRQTITQTQPISSQTQITPTIPTSTLSATTETTTQPTTSIDIEQKINEILEKRLKPIDYDEVAQKAIQIARDLNRSTLESFEILKETIKTQFEDAKRELLERQNLEKEQLLGSWTIRGFSPDDPVVLSAMQRLNEIHERELSELENKKNQNLANLTYSFMKTEPSQIFSIMSNILQTERTEVAPILALLRTIVAEREKTKREEAELERLRQKEEKPIIKERVEELEDGIYLITYSIDPVTGETRIISRIKLGAKGTKTSDIEKELNKMLSVKEAIELGVPIGTTMRELVGMVIPNKEKISMAQYIKNTSQVALDYIKEAKKRLGLLSTGILGKALENVPQTPAYELSKILDVIKSNVALQQIMQLKAASPTGATGFGALSDRELNVLQSTLGTLDIGLSRSRLEKTLNEIERVLRNITKRADEEINLLQKSRQITNYPQRMEYDGIIYQLGPDGRYYPIK